MTDIKIIRSGRKTVCIEITRDALVLVRAPYGMSEKAIKELIDKKSSWIEKSLENMRQNAARRIDAGDLDELYQKALDYISKRTACLAEKIGVTYGKITIRKQKTRWGSCSRDGNLSFNCMLMKAPAYVIDYVIVHELCHRKEMNHSKKFWAEVEKAMPDYNNAKKWLRENALTLLS